MSSRCRHCRKPIDRPYLSVCERCTKTAVDCPDCGGNGWIVEPHPMYGNYACPSPTVERSCRRCSETGLVQPHTLEDEELTA